MRAHLWRFALIAVLVGVAGIAILAHGREADAYALGAATDTAHNAGQSLTLQNESIQLRFVSVSAGDNDEFGLNSPGISAVVLQVQERVPWLHGAGWELHRPG